MSETRHSLRTARSLLLKGAVQGVGVRPALARLARSLDLSGFAFNSDAGVQVHIQGLCSHVGRFEAQLSAALPVEACAAVLSSEVPERLELCEFRILRDARTGCSNRLQTQVPTDRVLCEECRQELQDPSNRRFGYPFITCAQCGPRYSLIGAMPFERQDTAMTMFPLCSLCETEYHNVDDRRFHAQTMACPVCGPQLTLRRCGGDDSQNSSPRMTGDGRFETTHSASLTALRDASSIIRDGGLLAIRGIGGYQLACDATNAIAVCRLRTLKQRPSKPLAVMSLESGIDWKPVGPVEATALRSSENPIVVVPFEAVPGLSDDVSCGLPTVGAMLPTTALHELLLTHVGRPVVMTSGNDESDPILYRAESVPALEKLCDAILDHDRPIVRPIDDSVVQVIDERVVTIRPARGMAPLSIPFQTTDQILAVGAHQKSTVALSNGHQCVLGPHLGDLNTIAGRERWQQQVQELLQMYGTVPTVIAHDLHPEYFTTSWAQRQQVRTIAVPHHHAHVVSGMIESGLLSREVLGFAFDGTGFGPDETLWGGEILLATVSRSERVGSLLPFVLPGGEVAVHQPWRVAVSLIHQAMPELSSQTIASLLQARHKTLWHGACPTADDIAKVQWLISSGHAPVCSSMGRLFDGVAALICGIAEVSWEAEAAVRLAAAAKKIGRSVAKTEVLPNSEIRESAGHSKSPGFVFDGTKSVRHIDWRPVIRHLVRAVSTETCTRQLAWEFHHAVANFIVDIAQEFSHVPIVLSGGCFQNRLLTELAAERLRSNGRLVATPGRIPPNDGGLAAGQLAIAASLLEEERRKGTA